MKAKLLNALIGGAIASAHDKTPNTVRRIRMNPTGVRGASERRRWRREQRHKLKSQRARGC